MDSHTLTVIALTVLKVALLAFVIGGATAIVIRGVRRSRANRSDPTWTDHRVQPGHVASAHGAMPQTPLPEWVYWNEEENDDGHDTGRTTS